MQRKEHTIPTPEQMRELLDALSGSDSFHAILTCAVLGCRRDEALGLYWADLDFDACTVELKWALIVNALNNTVTVGELETKNIRRTLPMPDVLRDTLLADKTRKEQSMRDAGTHVINSPFVFTTIESKPFRPESVSQAFKRAAAKVGIPSTRLHDLRHTGITYMLMDGADPKTVSGFVGHATSQFTLNQYAHVMAQSKKKAGALLENRMICPSKSSS